MKRNALWGLIVVLSLAHGVAGEGPTWPDPKVPQGENLGVPEGWVVRLDHPDHPAVISADEDEADIWFVNMTPGWHITTSPAGIFYHPAATASGNYRAQAKIHFFDPKGRNEGYGMIIGGSGLDTDEHQYDYFLLRNSGEFLIKRRRGADTSMIQDWTASDSINVFADDESSVANDLAIECRDDRVLFLINGSEVASFPRSDIATEGIIGLRMNHKTNVHVEDLSVHPLD